MGGSNKTTQKTKDNQTSNANTTSNTTANTTGTSDLSGTFGANNTAATNTNPYGPASGLINSILGQAGNVQSPDFSGIQELLTGGGNNGLVGQLASGYNPATQAITDAATYGARNAASSNAAAAGRDLTSPGYQSSVAGNIARTLAPFQYANFQQGVSQIPGITGLASGLPYSGLFNKENLVLPIAQAFSGNTSIGNTSGFNTQHGTNSSNTVSNTQGTAQGNQFGTSTTTTQQPQNPLQVGIGGILGTLGLLSQGPSGGLGGALGTGLAGLF